MLDAALSFEALKPLGLATAPQVAVDGGVRFARDPVLWAGDGDSSPAQPAFFKRDQDMTDLRFCLDGIRGWSWEELHLFGFLGGRYGHTLANLGEIHGEMKRRPLFRRAVFHDGLSPAIFFFCAGAHALSLHGLFSVLAIEETRVSIGGACLYAADETLLPPLSGRGVSNRGEGLVSFQGDKPFMVVQEEG